jgi:hypothetical protein
MPRRRDALLAAGALLAPRPRPARADDATVTTPPPAEADGAAPWNAASAEPLAALGGSSLLVPPMGEREGD